MRCPRDQIAMNSIKLKPGNHLISIDLESSTVAQLRKEVCKCTGKDGGFNLVFAGRILSNDNAMLSEYGNP